MKAKLDRLKIQHRNLMAGYARVLHGVTNLPFFINLQKQELIAFPQPKNLIGRAMASLFSAVFQFFYIREFVNLFVEAHIRSKLTELARAYIQQSQMPNVNNQTKTWLKDTARECRDINDTLVSWTSARGVLAFFWPLITGFGLAFASAPNLYTLFVKVFQEISSTPQTPDEFLARLSLITSLGDMLFYGSLIGFGMLLISFTMKRKIFLQTTVTGNFYEMEDVLFAIMERRKEPEFPVDILSVWGALLLPFAVLGLILSFPSGASNEILTVILRIIFGVVAASSVAALLAFNLRKMK